MEFFIRLGIAVVGVVGAALVAAYLWNWIGPSISHWMQENGYEKSELANAWIVVDKVMSKVRVIVFAQLKDSPDHIKIEEKYYDIEQITDTEVLAELEKRGVVQKSVMELVS